MTSLWNAPPEAPTLAEHEIHVWFADLDAAASSASTHETTISPEELARSNRLFREHDRRHSIASRAILRRLLSMYTGVAAPAIDFQYHTNGKPFLRGVSGPDPRQNRSLEFNLSHSGGFALFAFSWNRRVGVDIERIRNMADIDRLARRALADEEYAAFGESPVEDKPHLFYRCWTCKEAVIKAAGTTIADVRRIAIPLRASMIDGWMEVNSDASSGRWALRELGPPPGYTAALAAESKATLSLWDVSPSGTPDPS